jgi:hypothetical protein
MSVQLAAMIKATPPWTADDKVLAAWIEQEIALPENDADVDKFLRQFAKGTYARRGKEPRFDRLDEDAEGRARPLPPARAMERTAIRIARAGNFKPLANRLDHPRYAAAIRAAEDAKDYALVAELERQRIEKPVTISGEAAVILAELARGHEPKRGVGRPKDFNHNPFYTSAPYRAARYAELVEIVLRKHYPKKNALRERAITIASINVGIKRSAIANQFKSGK